MLSPNLLQKTDIVVSCLMQHTNFNYMLVRENIKIETKPNNTFKYSVLFCIDANYGISQLFRLTDGVPRIANDYDFATGEKLYQNLAQSSYFVHLTDNCKNGMWGKPVVVYYLPDINNMRKSSRNVPSTGFDKFEFGLCELRRNIPDNAGTIRLLDTAAPRFILGYRTRIAQIRRMNVQGNFK